MKLLCLILTVAALSVHAQQHQTSTIYLIRHAEKADASADPDLSVTGQERAKRWSKFFAAKDISVAYTSPYRRTRETLLPLLAVAKDNGNPITLKTYNPALLSLKAVADENPGKNIIIAGHSNTIPGHINTLLSDKVYTDIPENQFGYLYVIKITGDTVTHELVKM
jgi:broad specificity phosphatase PhoE